MEGRPMKKQSFLRFLLLILTAINQTMLTLANHHHNSHHHPKIHLSHAMEDTRKFPCKEPQPRTYNLRDLVQSPSESVNRPVYIVQKRCDSHSGCCLSPDLSCAPVQSYIYYQEVEVEIWSLLTNSTRRVWVKIEQHDKCSCEISNASERFKADIEPPDVEFIQD